MGPGTVLRNLMHGWIDGMVVRSLRVLSFGRVVGVLAVAANGSRAVYNSAQIERSASRRRGNIVVVIEVDKCTGH